MNAKEKAIRIELSAAKKAYLKACYASYASTEDYVSATTRALAKVRKIEQSLKEIKQ